MKQGQRHRGTKAPATAGKLRGRGLAASRSSSRSPSAFSLQPSSFILSPSSFRLQPSASHRRAAFTMVEIMVAIGIIAILLAIAIPSMMGMLRTSKVKATTSTMQTLETAIEMFAKDDPLRGGASIQCGSEFTSSRTLFGPYPPTPSARFAFPPVSGCEPTPPPPDGDGENASRMTSIFFGFFEDELQPSPFNVEKFATIESLVFFLRRYNTGSRDLIDKLPDSVRKNLDGTADIVTIGGTPIELFEIVDAWGVPLVYNISLGVIEDSKGNAKALNHRWELRSAGEDGIFEQQFTDRAGSDDVVLRGTVLTSNP